MRFTIAFYKRFAKYASLIIFVRMAKSQQYATISSHTHRAAREPANASIIIDCANNSWLLHQIQNGISNSFKCIVMCNVHNKSNMWLPKHTHTFISQTGSCFHSKVHIFIHQAPRFLGKANHTCRLFYLAMLKCTLSH